MGVKLMARSKTENVKTNASLETPNRSGPQVVIIATDVQLSAVPSVINVATRVIVYFRLFVQLNGF